MTQANGATKLARRAARWSAQAYARPTAGLRLLPDYLIIGAQRAGTTSLHRYLVQHPGVRTTLRTKGVHFFDTGYGRGMSWYASRFPTRLTAWWVARRHGVELRTGEASPYYLFHPHVPGRVAEHLPQVKLIALLRDPVGRAYSHYQHEVARGFETLSFEEAIEAEPARLAGETERMLAEPLYNSFAHQHHSYLARGRYHEQLERWRARFDDRQLLVLSSERFFADPGRCFEQVLDFLELPAFTPDGYEKHNAHDYRKMGDQVARAPGRALPGAQPAAVRVARRRLRLERLVPTVAADDAARQDLTTLARGGALNLAGALATGLLHFVLLVVVTRGLAAEGTGAFYEAVALFLILSSAATLGADVGLSRMVPRYKALGRFRDLRRGLSVGLWPVAVVGSLLGLATFVYAPELADVFSRHGEAETARLADFIRAFAVFIPVSALSLAVFAATRGFATMRPTVYLDKIARPALQPLLVLAAILAGSGSTVIALAYLGPYLPVLVGRAGLDGGAAAPGRAPPRRRGRPRAAAGPAAGAAGGGSSGASPAPAGWRRSSRRPRCG